MLEHDVRVGHAVPATSAESHTAHARAATAKARPCAAAPSELQERHRGALDGWPRCDAPAGVALNREVCCLLNKPCEAEAAQRARY